MEKEESSSGYHKIDDSVLISEERSSCHFYEHSGQLETESGMAVTAGAKKCGSGWNGFAGHETGAKHMEEESSKKKETAK